MREPRFPEFTADRSLYRTDDRYQMAGSPDAPGGDRVVAAAKPKCEYICQACENHGNGDSCNLCRLCT
jgi:hypothetical protein